MHLAGGRSQAQHPVGEVQRQRRGRRGDQASGSASAPGRARRRDRAGHHHTLEDVALARPRGRGVRQRVEPRRAPAGSPAISAASRQAEVRAAACRSSAGSPPRPRSCPAPYGARFRYCSRMLALVERALEARWRRPSRPACRARCAGAAEQAGELHRHGRRAGDDSAAARLRRSARRPPRSRRRRGRRSAASSTAMVAPTTSGEISVERASSAHAGAVAGDRLAQRLPPPRYRRVDEPASRVRSARPPGRAAVEPRPRRAAARGDREGRADRQRRRLQPARLTGPPPRRARSLPATSGAVHRLDAGGRAQEPAGRGGPREVDVLVVPAGSSST